MILFAHNKNSHLQFKYCYLEIITEFKIHFSPNQTDILILHCEPETRQTHVNNE